MELTKQVCSLELAKKLKELGVKQESLFKWHSKIDIKGNSVHTELVYFPVEQMKQDISAFTVAELGEMLPIKSGVMKLLDSAWACVNDVDQYLWYQDGGNAPDLLIERASTEADARAKMLVYLLENKLLTL